RGATAVAGRVKHGWRLAVVRDFARGLGLEQGEMSITPAMERASSPFSLGVLQGIFEGHGSVRGDHEKGVSVRVMHADLELLRATQRMLLRQGIASSIHVNRGRPQHELVIVNDNLVRFRDVIGFSDTDKAVRLETLLAGYGRALSGERFTARVARVVAAGTE